MQIQQHHLQGGNVIDIRNENLTSQSDDDKVLAKFRDSGLSKEKVIEVLEMIEKQEVLSQYDFSNLKPDTKGMLCITVPDTSARYGKKRLYAKSIETLQEKVYMHLKKQPYSKIFKTFGYCFEEAQKFELQNTIPEKQVSRNNTINRNASEYRRFFKDTVFEDKFIDQITIRDIDEIIRFNLKRYKLKKGGRDSMRTLLNLTFKRALFMEWISDNPASKIIWKDYDRLLYKSAPVTQRAYSDEEISILHEHDLEREKKDPNFITAYAHEFQLLTAFRRGEICPLLWKDVDMEKGTIYVHQEQLTDRNARRKQRIVDHTKTNKDRYYPIADLETEFLERLKDVHDRYYPDSPYLFPADTENGCITCEAVEGYHTRSCKKLGILVSKEIKRGPHAFRRTRITEGVNNTNGNLVLVAQVYGNSPETIRKNYYTMDSLEKMRDALNKRKAI